MLLTPSEQKVFSRLSVFRGGFEVKAAISIAGAEPELLYSFVDQSLLRHTSSGRFEMHEAIRQYAAGQLAGSSDPSEAIDIQNRHARYYIDFLAGLIYFTVKYTAVW